MSALNFTIEAIGFKELVAAFNSLYAVSRGGKSLTRMADESIDQYLDRIIDRMDWHIARLRRL